MDAISNVFAEHVSFIFDVRSDAANSRRCRVHAPLVEERCLWRDLRTGECLLTRPVTTWDHALDGEGGPILRNTSICLNVAMDATLPPGAGLFGIESPWVKTGWLYPHTKDQLDGYLTDDFLGWYRPGDRGYLPYGFVGMDPCWVFRVVQSVDPTTLPMRHDETVLPPWRLYKGAPPPSWEAFFDAQGITGIPALACNPTWLDQWMSFADRSGRGGRPDGWVTSDPARPDALLPRNDAVYWPTLGGVAEPDDWWWNRDGSMAAAERSFDACADYVDGPDERDGDETCGPRDFTDWNRAPGELHPEGLEYIGPNDIQEWGDFECPLDRYGVAGGVGMSEWSALVVGVGHGRWAEDNIYFMPGNPFAFCGDKPMLPDGGERPDPVPMGTDAWGRNSFIDARWIDVEGRPALRFDIRLGARIQFKAWLFGGVMTYNIRGIVLRVTMAPRLCGSLDPAEFCMEKDEADGSCERTLGAPADGSPLCGFEFEPPVDGYFPDAGPGEFDWQGDLDSDTPEPLVLVNNNLLFDLDVTAAVDYEGHRNCPIFDVWCWLWSLFIPPIVEDEIADQATTQGAQMFNTLARVLYFDMADEGGNLVDTSHETGAAAYYLRKWFWTPALKLVRRMNSTIAPDIGALQFTDIRWTAGGPSSGNAEFTFVWDEDDDGVDDDVDNCRGVPNPAQIDRDRDCVGDGCDGDIDGDRCCEGCAGTPGATDCVCDGPGGVVDDPQCEEGCFPDETTGRCEDACFDRQRWRGGGYDMDRDGVPDDCDSDSDGDGWGNAVDNCPAAWNPDQADFDPNPSPAIDESDGEGNACDPDDDNDGCDDVYECSRPVAAGPAPDPDNPCDLYACVDTQCRTAREEDQADFLDPSGSEPACGQVFPSPAEPPESACESDDATCVWDPDRPSGEEFGCEWFETGDGWYCEYFGPHGRGGRIMRGYPEDVCLSTMGPDGGGSFLDECGFYAASEIPCAWIGGEDCCLTCDEPDVVILGGMGEELAHMNPLREIGREASEFAGMQIAVVRDLNANHSNDIAVSVPYAMTGGVTRGEIVTFDGTTLAKLRVRSRDGALGESMARVGLGVAARSIPVMSVAERTASDLEAATAAPAGVVVFDRWGVEAGFVPDPKNTGGTFASRATTVRLWDEEMAALYSPTCEGMETVGCLHVVDAGGDVVWSSRGYQNGNEYGASVDSDGTYVVVGLPGFNRGVGGMIRVYDVPGDDAWNVTIRDGVADFGRHVALVETASGTRLIASSWRGGYRVVLELTLRGQIIGQIPAPPGWEPIGIVSPTLASGRTTNTYAIVYRMPDGRIVHDMRVSDGASSDL